MNKPESQPTDASSVLDYRSTDPGAGGPVEPISKSTIAKFAGVLCALVLIAACMVSSGSKVRVNTLEGQCRSNLKNIAAGCIIYSNTHGGHYPDSLEEMCLSSGMSTSELVCRATIDTPATGTKDQIAAALSTPGHVSYIYRGKGLKDDASADTVLAYEPLGNHAGGINVLFADYSVKWLETADARKLLSSYVPGKPMVWRVVKGR